MAVIAPVHAELEFHHDPRCNAHDKVDAKKRTPKFRHLPPDESPRHHVNGFHDGKQHGKTQGQRYEEEVIKCRDCKLQSRQGDNIEFHLFKPVTRPSWCYEQRFQRGPILNAAAS